MTGVVMTFLVALLFDALCGVDRSRHSPVVTRGSTASSGGCLMDLFLEALVWLFSAEQYQGEGSIPQRTLEHLVYTFGATLIAAVIAVPIGYFIGHTGRGGTWVVGITGAARALPSFGLILLLVLLLGVSERVTASLVALVLLGIPPLMAGAYSGMHQIPRSTIDAARAQGMTEWQIIWTVEIPLSLPLLLGGLRGAVLQIVATATLVAYVGLGGLGYDIIQESLFAGLTKRWGQRLSLSS
jgi:osmoprotectant transport system permease protein